MGYSGRYHAASLAAVFVALAIGILIGAALGSDVLSGAADDLEKSLTADLNDARGRVKTLEGDLQQERGFEGQIYPAAVQGRLPNRRVALIGLGGFPEDVRQDIQDALDPSGASASELAVIDEPADVGSLLELFGTPQDRGLKRSARIIRAGRRAGRVLIGGGARFDRLRDTLLSRFAGSPKGIDGAVLALSHPDGLSKVERQETAAVQDAIIEGMRRAGVRVVGAESSDAEPSSIPYFVDHQMASVDNVDELPGKVALVSILAGADGNFGTGEDADGLLPEILQSRRFRGGASAGK